MDPEFYLHDRPFKPSPTRRDPKTPASAATMLHMITICLLGTLACGAMVFWALQSVAEACQ